MAPVAKCAKYNSNFAEIQASDYKRANSLFSGLNLLFQTTSA